MALPAQPVGIHSGQERWDQNHAEPESTPGLVTRRMTRARHLIQQELAQVVGPNSRIRTAPVQA